MDLRQELHNCLFSGHLGSDITQLRNFLYWSPMTKFIHKYCSFYHESPWEKIPLDFVTGLPLTSEYDSIVVIMVCLTKWDLIPTILKASAVEVAHMFVYNIIRLHGLSKKIISDRDPKFTSKIQLSTAYHPQAERQTERLNQTLGIMLRHDFSHLEFAYNRADGSSTGQPQFF